MYVEKFPKLANTTKAILGSSDGQIGALIGAGVVVAIYFIDKLIDNNYRFEFSDGGIVVEPAS